MIELNLVSQGLSHIEYKISNYPDGQTDIVLDTTRIERLNLNTVKIISRFNSFIDLEIIICTTKALRKLGVKNIHLYIPYLLGARSDRQFKKGGTSYLVDVVAPILNSLNFETITVLDVHSDVAAACINNLQIIDNSLFVKKSLNTICGELGYKSKDYLLLATDGGSLKKIYKLADYLNYKGEIITCSKLRDEEGNLTKTFVPYKEEYSNKDIIIVDDICDGGRTYINIVKEILNIDPNRIGKNYLITTHGIFSAGFKELNKYFNGLYCSNSIKDIGDYYGNDLDKTNLKQINIF